jgi:hypothetical protein
MDTAVHADKWPGLPYRGLDFYSEADACLFREREKDVRGCAGILLQYGVKILILQGSSGSGKSSFLRAGLIPYLKRDGKHRSFLLNCTDSVIRCTADPLPVIARSLLLALKSDEPFAESASYKECDEDALIGKALRRDTCHDLEVAIDESPKHLGDFLIKALIDICGDLPGKLILVLDQAEEVLTPTTDDTAAGNASAAFFRFLEEVYLRNVDVRILVALRTEYYGRFRDELKISDDRLGERPRSGGVEPYLLRPLRDKDALIRAVEFPAKVRRLDDKPVYNFAFDEGFVEHLVDDSLRKFPHASVTPVLQVVCAHLFERLADKNRTITSTDYESQGGLEGIISSYVRRSLGAIGIKKDGEVVKWHLLLHRLVSRQGGGTIVSLSETSESLMKQAGELEISTDVESALVSLTTSPIPLLRGEPPEDPREFRLKHDVLAIVIDRWHAKYEGAREETAKLRRQIKRTIFAGLALASIAGAIVYGREEATYDEKSRRIELTNHVAQHAPRGDFRLSLLLLASNLDATERPSIWHEKLTSYVHERLGGGLTTVRNNSLKVLRTVFARTPRFFYNNLQAVGIDPVGQQIALLGNDALEVVTLPSGDKVWDSIEKKSYPLPIQRRERHLNRLPAVGFVDRLGPAAFIEGHVYFWNKQDEPQDRDIWDRLLASFGGSSGFVRVEFLPGGIQATSTENRQRAGVRHIKILWLDGSKLEADTQAFPDASDLVSVEMGRPVPVFTNDSKFRELYAYLNEASSDRVDETSPTKMLQTSEVLEFGAVGGDGRPKHVTVPPPELGAPLRKATLAFAANQDTVLVKQNDAGFDVYYDLAKAKRGQPDGQVDLRSQRVTVAPVPAKETVPPGPPWLYPPLAGVKMGKHVRAAWLGSKGVSVVESSDDHPANATPLMVDRSDAEPGHEKPLEFLSGEPGGTRLQFTTSGDFLMLLQQQQYNSPVSVRIWDLRSAWRTWIEEASQEELRKEVCKLVRAEGKGGAFEEDDRKQFQIDPSHREPCPDTKVMN